MVAKKIGFIPTLTFFEFMHSKWLLDTRAQTKLAYDLRVRFACGADIGPICHGKNVREIECMIEAGLP